MTVNPKDFSKLPSLTPCEAILDGFLLSLRKQEQGAGIQGNPNCVLPCPDQESRKATRNPVCLPFVPSPFVPLCLCAFVPLFVPFVKIGLRRWDDEFKNTGKITIANRTAAVPADFEGDNVLGFSWEAASTCR